MLSIHGGPHGMYNVGFNFGWQEHAANGYVVLYTNPRGSSGYGSAFGNSIKRAYPGKDYDDLMAGVDLVLDRGYIDEDNMFVYGWWGSHFLGRGAHGPFCGCFGELSGDELAFVCRYDRWDRLGPKFRQFPVGRPKRTSASLPSYVCRKCHYADHAHDGCERSPHTDAAD